MERLAAALREALEPIPVVLWDERLTTVEAERLMIEAGMRRERRRRRIDRVAAALILQTYLDRRDGEGRNGPEGPTGSSGEGPDEAEEDGCVG